MTIKNQITGSKLSLTDLPLLPLFEVAKALQDGAQKYGAHNWRPGLGGPKASVHIGAAMRHLAQFWEGEDLDAETGIHHLAKAVGCILVGLDAQMLGSLVDDRPSASGAKGPPAQWLEAMNSHWQAEDRRAACVQAWEAGVLDRPTPIK